MPRAPARTQTAYEKLVSPSRAIAMGRPRGRSVTVDEHVHALTKEAAIMEATARDDERFALECMERATDSGDASAGAAAAGGGLGGGVQEVLLVVCRLDGVGRDAVGGAASAPRPLRSTGRALPEREASSRTRSKGTR